MGAMPDLVRPMLATTGELPRPQEEAAWQPVPQRVGAAEQRPVGSQPAAAWQSSPGVAQPARGEAEVGQWCLQLGAEAEAG